MRWPGHLLAALLVLVPLAQADGASAEAARPRHAAPPVRSPSPAASNGVAQGLSTSGPTTSQRLAAALKQIRATACAATIEQVSDFLLEGRQANFTVQPLGPDANRWPVVVVLESTHPELGRTRFSTIMAVPNVPCSGMYQQTIYWAEPCAELQRSTFATFGPPHVLLRDVQVSEANAGLQLYLMPGGSGCVSVKKELFH